jgi:urocanate hydratase
MVTTLNEAVRILRSAVHQKRATSVGLAGNCAEVLPEMARRGIVPDLLTDQTSAHDPLYGYIPAGLSIEQAAELRAADPDEYRRRSTDSVAVHVRAMLELKRMGSVVFDFGNNIRCIAADGGVEDAGTIPDFASEHLRPMLMEGLGPCCWVALSGEPSDIDAADTLACRLFPANETLAKWISLAKKKVRSQGLPARTGWLSYGERARFALEMNGMVASGELKAPIVIGSDHVDCASVASASREMSGLPEEGDAGSDWPVLNALLEVAAGASWVSINSAGSSGYSPGAVLVTVVEGTEQSARCLERVMSCETGSGVLPLLDAGYEEATRFAARASPRAPLKKGPIERS